MDLSKLPRLSNTPTPSGDPNGTGTDGAPAVAPVGAEAARSRSGEVRRGYDDDSLWSSLAGPEIWFMAVLGLIMVVLGRNWAEYHVSQWTHHPYHTNVTWSPDSGPKAGQEVEYPELEGFVSLADAAVFLFGAALVLDAISRVLVLVAPRLRRPLFALLLLFTLMVLFVNLNATQKLFRAGILPLLPMLGVAFLGYSMFQQWRLASVPAEGAPAAGRSRAGGPPVAAVAVDPTRDLLNKVLGSGPKARCTHYKFAHQALRQAAMENPARCVGLLQSPAAQRFLNDLWEAVRSGCAQVAEPGQAPEPAPLGLEADMTQVGPYSAAIVTLPGPQFPTEAYYVALVLRSYVRAEDGLTIERHPLLLYYTLEHGGSREDGSPRTVLAEWQAGTHLSYGDGPAPDASAFRDAVRERVEQFQKREDEAAGKSGLA